MTTFDSNKLNINIIGSLIPIIKDQNLENLTSEYWAISHLNCDDYKNIYDNYSKILICQDSFNEKITKFLESNREYLTNLVEADSIHDKDKIELFLRYHFQNS